MDKFDDNVMYKYNVICRTFIVPGAVHTLYEMEERIIGEQ